LRPCVDVLLLSFGIVSPNSIIQFVLPRLLNKGKPHGGTIKRIFSMPKCHMLIF